PPATDPPDDPPDDPPPGTDEPDPPVRDGEPLLSVSVSVSLGLPVLGGDGERLLDADVGVGLGTSLLGVVLVPGSVLLGRQIVVRRVRRSRERERP
ncbi:hypothetical protein, partial [Nonomuraea sp. KC401]|uniref:hypothetical protein n=2 Tax=unclassified Nonomuraea TaxID=2593643 RepID=UPI001BB137DB